MADWTKPNELTNAEIATAISDRGTKSAILFGYTNGAGIFDALVEEAARRLSTAAADAILSKVKSIVSKVDLSKVSPLPWKCIIGNYPIADTGDYDGYCEVQDERDNHIASVSCDSDWRRQEIEREDGDYDADMLAIADCVNAINAIKELLKEGE